MRFNRLADWLAWQETLHHVSIDLGLARVRSVATRLGITVPPFPLISVAGTNGKGSSVALLASIFQQAGYKVATYNSPHLLRYNERIQVESQEVSDTALIQAFDEVDQAREDTTLTYFEFGTLAAMLLFHEEKPDVVVLEVGLGGRLDAVNVFDADVGLITTIGLDHMAWLGHDRESIGREKAGIYRRGQPAICADPKPPASVAHVAQSIGALWYGLGKDFRFSVDADKWHWESNADGYYHGLPKPALAGAYQIQNAAGALMAIRLLRDHLPVSKDAVRRGLRSATLPGRFQIFSGQKNVTMVLDVAHNPQAAEVLADGLQESPCNGRTLAVVAMLGDKSIEGVLRALWTVVNSWYVSDLHVPRGATAETIMATILQISADADVHSFPTTGEAWRAARESACPGDQVVVFGSFHTVSEVLRMMKT